MIKLEKILGVTALIALILKFIMIPGGGILFTLSLLILASLYYPLGFALLNKIEFKQILKRDPYKGLSALRIVGTFVAGVALSTICIGILFKIQQWNGSKYMILAGLIITLIVLIIALIKYFKAKGEFYIGIFKRIAIIGILGIIFICISDLTIAKIQYRNHPDYIKAYELYLSNPQDDKLKQNLDLEYFKILLTKEEFEMYLKQTEKQ